VEESWSLEIADGFQKISNGFYDNLYAALTKGEKLEVTLDQVRRQVHVLEECHRQNPLPKLPAKLAALKKRA
jgi:hypothetical protein